MNVMLFFELFGGLDAFPGGGNLDENAALLYPDFLVQADEAKCLLHGCFGVKGEPGIDFGADATRNHTQDLLAKIDQQLVHGPFRLFGVCATLLLAVCHRIIN